MAEISRSRREKLQTSIARQGVAKKRTSQLATQTTSRIDSLQDPRGTTGKNADETFLKTVYMDYRPRTEYLWMPKVMLIEE
jgi:hypothetical protein